MAKMLSGSDFTPRSCPAFFDLDFEGHCLLLTALRRDRIAQVVVRNGEILQPFLASERVFKISRNSYGALVVRDGGRVLSPLHVQIADISESNEICGFLADASKKCFASLVVVHCACGVIKVVVTPTQLTPQDGAEIGSPNLFGYIECFLKERNGLGNFPVSS